MDIRAVEQLLADITPEGAWSAAVEVDFGPDDDTPRWVERAAGARAASRALSAAGVGLRAQVGRDSDGVPTWPAGITGSISHSGGLAVATVGSTSMHRCLGLDVEVVDELRSELHGDIGSDAELMRVGDGLGATTSEAAAALFCAKEALYKAHYPVRREVFGFRDVELSSRDGAMWTASGDVLGDDALRVEVRRSAALGLVVALATW